MRTVDREGPDLVVAGAGGGLIGALRAASLGRSVLVVEKNAHFAAGNNTAMSTAMIPGAGSRWQRKAGVDDSPSVFLGDVMAKTGGDVDLTVARTLTEVSARLVEWMADEVGLPMSLVTDFPYPGHSRLRCHTVPGRSGRALLRGILTRLRASDLIDLMMPAELTHVHVGTSGVEAVTVTTPFGQETIPTDAVLLATSGYAADPVAVAEHIPGMQKALYYGSEGSTGDALRIGRQLGAGTGYLDSYQGHAALAMPAATLAGWATVMHGGFLVNRDGRRFGDETAGYSEYASTVLAAASGQAWIVIDRRIHDACTAFSDFQDTVEAGALRWGSGAAELAYKVGIDPSGLANTIARAAACARGEVTDEFGRQYWEAPLEGDLAAIPVSPALFHTQGGLLVDVDARVISSIGTPIPGLYASGGAAVGMSGHGASGYLAGNGLLPAFGLALLAAEHVCKQ